MASDPKPPGPPGSEAETKLLSRGDVARLFGVSPSSVTRWARAGLIKAFRTPGGHYRFPAEEARRVAQRLAAGEPPRRD